MPKNRGHVHREQIDAGAEGRAVLAHLMARWRASEAEWRARLAAGEVLLDEARTGPEERLRRGQWLTWARPPWEEPAVPLCAALLYEPICLHSRSRADCRRCPAGVFSEHTLLAVVRRRAPEASPMHRLGRATSGVVLFSRTPQAARVLAQSFRDRSLCKIYRALCSGHPTRDEFAIDAPIGEVPHPLLGTVHGASAQGRPSRSHVRVLERRESAQSLVETAIEKRREKAQSLVEVAIETGRPHQIRIHLAHAGHPLCGDPLYGVGGVPLPGSRALPGDPGYLLHALRVELAHPRAGAPRVIECAPPPPLR